MRLSPVNANQLMVPTIAPVVPSEIVTEAPEPTSRRDDTPQAFPHAAPPIQSLDLQEEVEQLQEAVQAFGVGIRFSVDRTTRQVIVQVYDTETQQVIREIPPQQIVKALSKIMSVRDARGILLDQQV